MKTHTFLIPALNGGEGSASCSGCFTPGKETSARTGYEAGWAPELVSVLSRREKSLALPGIKPKFSGHTAHSSITILTELPYLIN
jgi:hypothetical protein